MNPFESFSWLKTHIPLDHDEVCLWDVMHSFGSNLERSLNKANMLFDSIKLPKQYKKHLAQLDENQLRYEEEFRNILRFFQQRKIHFYKCLAERGKDRPITRTKSLQRRNDTISTSPKTNENEQRTFCVRQ